MKDIIKVLIVAFLVYFIAIILLTVVFRTYIPDFPLKSHALLITRLLALYTFAWCFYTKKFGEVPNFLGFKKRFFKPFLFGIVFSLPFAAILFPGLVMAEIPITVSLASLLALLTVILGPGFFEEGLFRGLLFNELTKKMKWGWAALISGLFFGPAHLAGLLFGWGLDEALAKTFFGLVSAFVFGYIFIKMKGNIWACFSLHFMLDSYVDCFIKPEHVRQNLDILVPISIIGLVVAYVFAIAVVRNKKIISYINS